MVNWEECAMKWFGLFKVMNLLLPYRLGSNTRILGSEAGQAFGQCSEQ